MAAVNKSGLPSPCNRALAAISQMTGNLIAGEDIAPGDACYIAANKLVMRSTGAAANAAAKVSGFADVGALVAQGDSVTLIRNCPWGYGKNLTPGVVYLSGTVPGGLDTAASTGGTAPIGFIYDDTRIWLHGSAY